MDTVENCQAEKISQMKRHRMKLTFIFHYNIAVSRNIPAVIKLSTFIYTWMKFKRHLLLFYIL